MIRKQIPTPASLAGRILHLYSTLSILTPPSVQRITDFFCLFAQQKIKSQPCRYFKGGSSTTRCVPNVKRLRLDDVMLAGPSTFSPSSTLTDEKKSARVVAMEIGMHTHKHVSPARNKCLFMESVTDYKKR